MESWPFASSSTRQNDPLSDHRCTVIYGNDMTQGSSGGPWIQNFGLPAIGQTGGANNALNRVVGVMSYGPLKGGEFWAGSSILDQRFTTIFNQICAHRAGNCS